MKTQSFSQPDREGTYHVGSPSPRDSRTCSSPDAEAEGLAVRAGVRTYCYTYIKNTKASRRKTLPIVTVPSVGPQRESQVA